MATPAGSLIQDQNLNLHFNGAPVMGKTNVSKAQKKGGLGGRKALNDISNSGKPSALQVSKKHNPLNMISIEEDLVVSKSNVSVGGKANVSKAQEKKQVGSRKALSDLTNAAKPSVNQVTKKIHDKKLNAVSEENFPGAIAEERFLHNHQECINAQRKGMDMNYFLRTVGLDNDISMQLESSWAPPPSRNSKLESPSKYLEMEEMSELLIEDRFTQSLPNSPQLCGTPTSPSLYTNWKDYNFPNFMLMEH